MTAQRLLNDTIVLISGGTHGLGAGIARQAAAEGAAGIAVTGRSAEAGRRVAGDIAQLGVPAVFLQTDLADANQASSSVTRTIDHFGRLDAVVNAAGLTTRGTMTDTSPELFDAHIAVNLKAPFFIMSEAIKHLKEREAGGSIVNIISMSEHAGQPYLAPYVASKAGLAGLTRNAAHAHRWDKIRINGPRPTAKTSPSAGSTAPAMTGSKKPTSQSRWASSARSTRSPNSWSSCSRHAAAW